MARCGWKENGTAMFRLQASLKLASFPVAALAIVGGLAIAQQSQPPAVFKENVSMVHVIASVKNARGELVGGLKQENFKILDNGVAQDIRVFERQTSQPLSIALLVDASGSTAKDLKYETDSASKFLKALVSEGNPKDAVSLFSFDSDVREVRDFTRNFYSLDMGLKSVHGSGGTSLYDAIYLATGRLDGREGRKVMVVISDGGNTTSTVKIEKALKTAQYADVLIYSIVDLPITNDAGRNTGGEHALEFLTAETGGHKPFYPSGAAEMDKAFSDIIDELRTEYFLAFYPKGVPLTKNPYHKLEVQVADRPDLRVFARNGYYGEAEGAERSPDPQVAVTPAGRKKK